MKKQNLVFILMIFTVTFLTGCENLRPIPNENPENNGSQTGDQVINKKDYFNEDVYSSSLVDRAGSQLKSNLGANRQATESLNMSATQGVKDMSNKNIGFKVGADQDMQLFRENIESGHIPSLDSITYNGIFGDYHFGLPNGDCESMFCPLTAGAEITNPTTDEQENWVQIGLGSNIKQKDFQRPPTNFVFVIDKSGSMGGGLSSYYYDKNNIFNDDWEDCRPKHTYFKPSQKCIALEEKSNYKERYIEYTEKSKMELSMEALSKMLKKLQPEDRFGLVLYDNNAMLAHPLVKVNKFDITTLQSHLKEIQDGGGTNMEAGMRKGLELFNDDITNQSDYQNRMVFLTDAMPNIGLDSPQGLGQIALEGIQNGIYMSFMGVGVDFQQQFVQNLSKHRGTNYFYISDSWDFQKRLVEEFDYNFFPMLFDLSFKVDQPDLIDKIYGLDSDVKSDGELMHINTMFPTPPTDNGHRGSIILLKLKDTLEKELKLQVSYETYKGEKKETKAIISQNQFNDKPVIQKAVVLIEYVDNLKKSINNNDIDYLESAKQYMEQSIELFSGDDKKVYNKDLETLEKLKELIKKGETVKKDYWEEQ